MTSTKPFQPDSDNPFGECYNVWHAAQVIEESLSFLTQFSVDTLDEFRSVASMHANTPIYADDPDLPQFIRDCTMVITEKLTELNTPRCDYCGIHDNEVPTNPDVHMTACPAAVAMRDADALISMIGDHLEDNRFSTHRCEVIDTKTHRRVATCASLSDAAAVAFALNHTHRNQ